MKKCIFLLIMLIGQSLFGFDKLLEHKLKLLKQYVPTKSAQPVTFDESFSLKYTTSDSFLKRPICIEFHDEKLFILENNLHKMVVFNKSGEFVRKFGGPGQGPGDIYYPAWFDIQKDKLYIKNNNGIDIFGIDYTYLERVRLFLSVFTFSIADDHIYTVSRGVYRERYPFMVKYNLKGKIEEAYYDKSFERSHFRYDNRGYIAPVGNDVVFIPRHYNKLYICNTEQGTIKIKKIKYKLLDEIGSWNDKKDIKHTRERQWFANMVASAKVHDGKLFVLLEIPRLEIIGIDLEGNVTSHFYDDRVFKLMRWRDFTIESRGDKLVFYVMGFYIGEQESKYLTDPGVYRVTAPK